VNCSCAATSTGYNETNEIQLSLTFYDILSTFSNGDRTACGGKVAAIPGLPF
jgi:hypothetical protein